MLPMPCVSLRDQFDLLLSHLAEACRICYRDRLVSLAVFGSVGRGTPRPDSDVDLLIVAEDLPQGRMRRMAQFERVESAMKPRLSELRRSGVETELSPVFKTPAEVHRDSPLFLDMTTDARLLYDREAFLQSALERLKAKLESLGARRIYLGNAWYWDLKPDFKPGDVIDL